MQFSQFYFFFADLLWHYMRIFPIMSLIVTFNAVYSSFRLLGNGYSLKTYCIMTNT